MNPQEQNKATATSCTQKSEAPKQPVAANGPADASVKPMDKDAGDCITTKGSCGTK